MVHEAAKYACSNKTNESISFLKLGSSKLQVNFLSKGKFAIPPLFHGPEGLFSTFCKVLCLREMFSENCKCVSKLILITAQYPCDSQDGL